MRESERYNEYELVYMILQGDEHSLQLLLHQYQPKINAIIKQNCTYQVMIRHHEGDLNTGKRKESPFLPSAAR